MDNSRIDCFNCDNDTLSVNIFSSANPGFHLGDLAYSFARLGDTVFVSVTTAGVIYAVHLPDFKAVGMIKLAGDPAPRKIYIQNKSRAYITNLYDSSVTIFNPTDFTIISDKIRVGPAPEGITGRDDLLFVANSGYGDYFANKPLAGTISVINTESNRVITNLYCGPNPVELLYNKANQRLYAVYYNLPSMADSVGGIVEYNTDDFTETRRIHFSAHSLAVNPSGDTLLFLNKEGLFIIDLHTSAFVPKLIISNPNPNHLWYSVAVSKYDNSIWIGNSRNYAVNGEIIVYNNSDYSAPRFRFNTGINPNTILFY
jgi:hypothetical protein